MTPWVLDSFEKMHGRLREMPEGDYTYVVSSTFARELSAALMTRTMLGATARRIEDPGFLGWYNGLPVVARDGCPDGRCFLMTDRDIDAAEALP